MAKSELHFLGHIVDLLTVETVYNKDFNKYKGTPILYNKGGLLKFVFDFEANFRFLERMKTVNYDLYKQGYPIDDGKIVFYDANGDNLKDWYFKDAPVVYYQFKFDANGGGMRIEMIISPAIQNYGCKIHRSWHITPIEEESYQSPVQATEKKENFNLSIQHLIEKETLVPLGIPAFNKSPENQNIEFEIAITENGIDDFQVEFLHDNKIIQSYYSGEQTLDEVVVTAKGSGNSSNSTTNSQNTQNNYPKGKYHVKWDGFDKNGIYDSTIFTTGKLKARIKGKRNGIEKTAESSEFSFEYNEVTWVDTKINKNTKRIDVTLRVNLRDGGANGIKCIEKDIDPDPKFRIPVKECPWDKIPKKDLIADIPPLKTRTKSFKNLKELALKGISTYWSRHKGNIARGVKINEEIYEVFINPVNETKSNISLDDVPLIYNTNEPWSRSGNTGGNYNDGNWDDEAMGLIPNGIVQRISYNIGYIKYSNGWGYKKTSEEDLEFKFTSAHEIGHEIIQAFAGTVFSWQHKGTSYYLPQDKKPTKEKTITEEYLNIDYMNKVSGEDYPYKGEIDLMKYYNNDPFTYDYKRIVANKKDVLGLLWLSKLKIK